MKEKWIESGGERQSSFKTPIFFPPPMGPGMCHTEECSTEPHAWFVVSGLCPQMCVCVASVIVDDFILKIDACVRAPLCTHLSVSRRETAEVDSTVRTV